MAHRFLSLTLATGVALAAALPLACSSGGSSEDDGSTSSGPSDDDGAGGDTLLPPGDQTLEIVPPDAVIEVVDGVSAPVDFDLLLDGKSIGGAWSVSKSSVATVDAEGIVTATNDKGGELTLLATHGAETAQAKVTVLFKKTLNPAGASPEDQDKLKSPTGPDASVVWQYPYDRTVFPKAIAAPEMMWAGGGDPDLYYVHYQSQFVDIGVFTTAPNPSRFLLDEGSWTALTESGKGGTVDVVVNRLPAGADQASSVIDHDWTIAAGPLRGTVYYWANNLGRIVRIKPGEPGAAPEDFLAPLGTGQCYACHTVSANGHTMVVGGDAPLSTFDLLSNTAVLDLAAVGKPVRNWAMPALSPDGTVLVENNAQLPGPPGGSDGMWDTQIGAKLGGTGLDGVLLDMPAFGPSGTKLVYVRHDPPRDLMVFDFDATGPSVANQLMLVPQSNVPGADAIAFPSVAPTITTETGSSTWVAYHRGVYPGSLDTRFGPGEIYVASADTPGIEIRLEEVNGDNTAFAAGDRDRGFNYEPTFAPEPAGGYHWIVFTSRRTYGNRLTGTSDVVKQLWIAAIDLQPTAGQDPSHPAFWLPGQDLATLNMRGYWANDACIAGGEACEVDSDCCGGTCTNGVCENLPPEECSEIGEVCTTAADCCDPNALCQGGVCALPAPK